MKKECFKNAHRRCLKRRGCEKENSVNLLLLNSIKLFGKAKEANIWE